MSKTKNKTPKKKNVFKIVGKWLLVLGLFFLVLLLFIRSPWGQQIIVTKATQYISGKTGTKVEIKKLFITFSGGLQVDGLYLEDQKGDTLVYSKSLKAQIPIFPILRGGSIALNSLEWEGLRANIKRNENSEQFNFTFLIEAFASKDTIPSAPESTPLDLSIGRINFKDFIVAYEDDFLGMHGHLKLGELKLAVNNIDLEQMDFDIDDVELSHTQIDYRVTKSALADADSTETKLPSIRLGNFKISQTTLDYNSIPDRISANLNLDEFLIEQATADLSLNDFGARLISLKNSIVAVQLTPVATPTSLNVTALPKPNTPFEWPKYKVDVDKISFANNTLQYQYGNAGSAPGFDPEDINIANLTFDVEDLAYGNEKGALAIKNFSLEEKSGFILKNASMAAKIHPLGISIPTMSIETNNSAISGSLALTFASIDQITSAPDKTTIALNIPSLSLSLQEAYLFAPTLAQNPYFESATKNKITGSLRAKGSLESIELNEFVLNWGANTHLDTYGVINNALDPTSLSFNFETLRATTSRADLIHFIAESDFGISFPETIVLNASANGDLKQNQIDASLVTSEGALLLKGNYSNLMQHEFDGVVNVDNLELDKILNNPQLGGISFQVDVNGSGNSMNTLNMELRSHFSKLVFNAYDFSGLELDANMVSGEGDIQLNFKDNNLDFTSTTHVVLDTIHSRINLGLDLVGADLQALGITKENIKVGALLQANFNGSPEDFKLNASISEGVAVQDTKQYPLNKFEISAAIHPDSTAIALDSDFLDGFLKSNSSPKELSNALQKQFKSYFYEVAALDTVSAPIQLELKAVLRETPLMNEVFLKGIEHPDTISMQANFDSSTRNFKAELRIPSAIYKTTTIDSLNVLIHGDETNLDLSVGFAALKADPILIKRTFLEGTLHNKELHLDFLSFDEAEKLIHVASELTFIKDTLQVHINPLELILNKKSWEIPQDNQITIASKYVAFNNFDLRQNNQLLTISNSLSGIEQNHIGVAFENFGLQTFLSLFNPDEALASGLVKGRFVMENPFEAAGIIADFDVSALEVMSNPLGNLSVNASSTGKAQYDFDLTLKDGDVDLDLKGDYTAREEGALLNLDLELNTLQLKLLEGLSGGALKDTKGTISGNVTIGGTTAAPEYNGKLMFNEANFTVASLNAPFSIDNESLTVNNAGIYLDEFKIADANTNYFTLKGSILTETLTNPSFNLNLNAEGFQILNSSKENNELFYGNANINADVTITGNLELPKIDGTLTVGKVTDITYVVPETQFDLEERDGVVIFVNRENPDDILTRNEGEQAPSIFNGVDAHMILEIADDAVFNILIDERTGDNLQVSGNAALNLNIEANGRINLSGRYELNSGHYETSLYNLVKRKFEIKPGSTITWQGDPMDAKLDVTAIYKIDASAAPLMSSLTSGQDPSVVGKYRQVLPFLVYLNIDGQLLEPKLSFAMDMPEEAQGALGGAVFGRIQQLNEQETELNKQVFSLLALNRFFPDSGSDGSNGGATALARDNVNKVLSGELNAFSDKVFGQSGFELDFDLESFTDYQGENPEDRTQLNINARKKLFNDRLIVTAGSAVDVEGSAQAGQESTPVIGNVSLEYLLTENGQYRLKGFQKNEFQNVIDGQLTITGIALIFNREFNKFSQLFNPLKELNASEAAVDKKSKEAIPDARNEKKN